MNKLHLPKHFFLIALTLFILSTLAGLYYWGWSIDDPWIAYRYAQNLSSGNGLIFNIGEKIEAYSSLTIILILAFLMKLGLEPDLPCRIIGLLSSSAIPVLMFLFSVKFFGGRPFPLLILGAFLYAINPSSALWSVGGLETTLYALIQFLIFWLFLSEELEYNSGRSLDSNSERRSYNKSLSSEKFRFSFLLMFIASLTRIESPIIFLSAFSFLLIKYVLKKEFPPKRDINGVIVFLLLYSIYTIFRVGYFGDLLPNTFYAKVTGSKRQQILDGIKYTLNFIRLNGSIILFFPILPIIFFSYKKIFRSTLIYFSPTQNFWLLFYSLCGWNLFFIVYCGGDWMPLSRFFVHFLPILFIGVQEGISFVWEIIENFSLTIKTKKVIYYLLFLLIFYAIADQIVKNYNETKCIVERTSNGTFHQQYFEVGKFLKEYAPKDALFAAEEAGIIPYESGLRFLDMLGLVDKHIGRLKGRMHSKFDSDYILNRNPDFVLIHATLDSGEGHWIGIYPAGHDLLNHPEFHKRYKLIKMFIRGDEKYGKNGMYLFERIKR